MRWKTLPRPELALERDVAAHRPREATADRQPETGAGGGPLGLVELLEDHLVQLRRDAGAGVADRDVETSAVHPCSMTWTSPASVNLSAFPNRLTRIWRTRWRSSTTSAGAPVSCHPKRIPFCAASERCCATTVSTSSRGSNGSTVEGELPGLDLRQVEDLVDQPEQILPAALDPAERRFLLRVERTVHAREERIGEAEDRVHRRAQLVADVRQETRLRLAAPFERRVRCRLSRVASAR